LAPLLLMGKPCLLTTTKCDWQPVTIGWPFKLF
jgi:hypothetical protein